jgi:hypothetical protein
MSSAIDFSFEIEGTPDCGEGIAGAEIHDGT